MEKTTLVLVPDFTSFSCQIVMVQTTFFMGSLWYKNEEKKIFRNYVHFSQVFKTTKILSNCFPREVERIFITRTLSSLFLSSILSFLPLVLLRLLQFHSFLYCILMAFRSCLFGNHLQFKSRCISKTIREAIGTL